MQLPAHVHRSLTEMRSLLPMVRQCVSPLTVFLGDKFMQFGTGTLFRVGDISFLATAGHVWTEAVKNGYDICVFDITPNNAGMRLQYAVVKGPVYFTKDPTDIAVFELDASVVQLLSNRLFLRLNQMVLQPTIPGWCWVYGFPSELNTFDAATSTQRFNQFSFFAPFRQDEPALDNYDRRFHLLINVPRDKAQFLDGRPGELPDRFEGMSGCSIWQPNWRGSEMPTTWTPDNLRIVGIQTSYYRRPSVIKGTCWGAVARVLYDRKPELRRIIEWHLNVPKSWRASHDSETV